MSDNATSRAGDPSRRAVFGGIVGLGVGVPLIAACGSDDGGGDSGSGGDSGGTSAGTIGKTSEVPVGGGKIFAADKVVVTQPTEGDFKAFSALCTHQGCVVSKIEGKDIDCTCHGSKFSIEDGSVVNGPAKKPLEQLSVKTDGGKLTVG